MLTHHLTKEKLMSKAIISEELLTDIADELRDKYESTDTYTPAQMADAVSGLTKVSGSITINVNGSIDVTRYASANVDVPSEAPTLQDKTVNITPTTTAQSQTVSADSGYDGLDEVTINTAAVPTGTEGTPTATKGAVSNHSVSVTPAVTNDAGMIVGGTHTGTPVTVSASELVSGSETKTANGTYDVTNLSEVVVDVPTPPSVEVEPLSVTDNGTYTAPSGKAYSPVTVNVSGGGGGSAEPNDVEYIDYDGTIVYSYSAADFAQLTAHPANPTHDGLVAQGWNWTLSDAQAYVAENGGLTIGQMYITESGDSEIDIELREGRLSPYLSFAPNGTVEIDWGDGSSKDTLTGTSLTTQKSKRHMYSAAGAYTITLHVVSGSFAFFGTSSKPLLNDNGSSANYNYVYSNSVKAVRIGSDASIESYAFANCQSLASISMPSGLTIIKDHAFLYCYSLAFASIPNGVTSIGDYTFDYCYSLTSISMPGGVTSESTYTFRNCKSLRRVYIPNGVTSIGSSAFNASYSIASISIPSGITRIGNYAFYTCYGIGEFHVKASTPPTISSNTFGNIRSDCKFYVPAESLEAYKTASNWSNFASRMVGE